MLAAIPGYTKLFKAIYQHQLNENSERDPICTLLPHIIYQRQSHHEFRRDLVSTALFKAIYRHQGPRNEESAVELLPLIHLAEVDDLDLT